MIVKVSLAFARLTDAELDNFAHGVSTGMTGNTAFASPPVPMVNLNAAIVDFTAKVAAAQAGGPMDTAAKNTARQTLLGMLRQLATYVQMMCNNDDAVLLSSGFSAQGPRSASTALEQPQSLSIRNGGAGQLIASVDPVRNANMYEGRIKLSDGGGDGNWSSIYTGDSQHIIFDGLARGKDYTVQVRALGGSTGQSDWSDPSSHMAM
ncbi:MAG TPA: fibronectin type III domain-containing protein [Pyrinomonadaceae bacterium]|nr:fibronectin type III domain-containing protein [Pyrinomonadaceae bacterium]